MPDLADEPPLSVAHGSFEKNQSHPAFFFYLALPPEGSKFKVRNSWAAITRCTHHQNCTHRTAHTAINGHMEGRRRRSLSPGRRVVRGRGAVGGTNNQASRRPTHRTGVNGWGGWVMGGRTLHAGVGGMRP